MKRILAFITGLSLLLLPSFAFADLTAKISSYDIFTPTLQDRSVAYLGQVFGTVGGAVHGTSGQLLAELFRVFNYGIAAIVPIILCYALIMGVINTAQEGEFMGRKMNSAWVALRAVVGLGILVPKYTGYSLVQVLIMWVTVQGVGLADKIWATAVDHLVNENGVIYAVPGQTVNKGGLRKTLEVGGQVLNAEVCMYKLQDVADQTRQDAINGLKKNPNNPTWQALAKQPYPRYHPVWDDNNRTVTFGTTDKPAACGTFGWGGSSSQTESFAKFDIYQRTGLEQMVNSIAPTAKNLADTSNVILPMDQANSLRKRTQMAVIGASQDYENIMQPALRTAQTDADQEWRDNLTEAKEKGWIVAGSYYWDLAKVDNKLNEQLGNYQPTGSAATIAQLEKEGVDSKAVEVAQGRANKFLALPQLTVMLRFMETEIPTALSPQEQAALINYLTPLDPDNEKANADKLANARNAVIAANGSQVESEREAISTDDKTKTRVITGTTMAAAIGVAAASGGVGAVMVVLSSALISLTELWFGVMNSPGDPIAMVQTLGQGMLGIAVALWLTGSVLLGVLTTLLSIGGSMTGVSYGIQNGLKMFVPIVISFILALFVNGMVLSVYVPLIPYFIFTFASIGWLISVLEATVAGPLVAAALTHPEGHDLLGKAEQAIMLLLGVFLRPAVMVIGFLAAMILARVSLRIVNAGFSHVTTAGNITLSGFNIFGTVGLMIVYTMIVISLINLVFNAGVVKLWETIWMWIGFHQPGSSVESALQELKSGAHGGAQTAGELGGGLVRGGADTRAGQLGRGEKGGIGGFRPEGTRDREGNLQQGGWIQNDGQVNKGGGIVGDGGKNS